MFKSIPFVLLTIIVFVASFSLSKNTDNRESPSSQTDTIIAFADDLMGKPYRYGGCDASGFDCSGFVYFVFQENNVSISRSSKTQIKDGHSVSLNRALPGDVIVFTGTDVHKRTAGHTGIVHHWKNDTLHFIHASSKSGVKINAVQEGYYTQRFLDVRRIIK